ncbi:MAG: PAS domain S-box protein [bacterium]
MKRVMMKWIVAGMIVTGLSSRMLAGTDGPQTVRLTQEEREWISAHPEIRLSPDPNFPPTEYFDENGRFVGIAADFIALVEQRTGIRFSVVCETNWEEIIKKIKRREIDMLSAFTETPQRTQYLSFTRSYFELPIVIIVRETTRESLTLDEIKGMKVAVVSGSLDQESISERYPDLELDAVPDYSTGLRKVSFGMADAVVCDLASATYYIKAEGISNLRVAGRTGYSYKLSFAVRKDWPELVKILEKGLSAISQDERVSIYEKWIRLEREPFFSRRSFWTGLVVGICGLSLFVMGVGVWNRALRRRVEARTSELSKELTERRKVEKALRESEERFKILFEYAPDTYYLNDLKGVFIDGNRASEKLVGYKKEELIGKSFLKLNLIASHQISKAAKLLAQNVLGKATGPEEFILNRKDGTQVHTEIQTYPVKIQGRTLVLGIARDITERKRVEKALSESEKRFRELAESLPETIWETDMEGKLTFVNQNAFSSFGYTQKDFKKGVYALQMIVPEERENGSRNMRRVLEGEKTTSEEYTALRQDGTTFPVIVYSDRVVRNGKPVGLRGIIVDITDRKKSEEKIKSSLNEKEVLLKEIHHRVKNNLAVISSLLSLQSRHIKDKEAAEMFRESQSRVKSLALIHERLYKSGDLAKVDFTEYVRSTANDLYRLYGADPNRIGVEVDVKNVSLPVNLAVPCGLIINELVSNALKHAFPPSWKEKGSIRISLHPVEGDQIELVVQDNGVGLAEDVDLKKTESLGLKLVSILAEDQLKGNVEIERNEGVLFRITFKF